MSIFKLIVIFLIINFGALALGSWLMDGGSTSTWYMELNKAPWTPPGWLFGVAWSFIMLCFSFYMAYLYKAVPTTTVKILFAVQFVLNVSWNYIFFNQHLVGLGLLVIALLTILIAVFLFAYNKQQRLKSLFILPYLIWLCIATSLNAYILFNN